MGLYQPHVLVKTFSQLNTSIYIYTIPCQNATGRLIFTHLLNGVQVCVCVWGGGVGWGEGVAIVPPNFFKCSQNLDLA